MERRGFTLLELAIALGIMSVLAAIGFVSFSKSIKASKINQTASLEKQVAAKIVRYAVEKGNLPPTTEDLSKFIEGLPKDPLSEPMPSKWAWDGNYIYAVKFDGSKTLPFKLESAFPFSEDSSSYYGSYSSSEEPYCVLSRYGIIVNGGFEQGEAGWHSYNGTASVDTFEHYSGKKSLLITGNPNANVGCYQKIDVVGHKGDSFDVVYHSKPVGNTKASWYGCEVYFHYTDGTHSYQGQWHPNRYEEDWQTGKKVVTAGKDYDYIRIYLIFYRADGKAYFDDIEMFRR